MRAPREAPPPTRFVKSPHGTVARLIGPLSKRDAKGRKLYRLEFLSDPTVVGDGVWSLAELEQANVRWLKARPRIQRQKRPS